MADRRALSITLQPVEIRDRLAASAARSAALWARRSGHGGSSLPGMVAERLAPGIAGRLAAQLEAIAVISGTNGKTTTTHLLDHILESRGRRVITNRSGANLSQAISTTIVDGAIHSSGGRSTTAVIECDEFALSDVSAQLQPRVIVLTNLFRDQLDRYTEIDEIERRWVRVLDALPHTTVVAPADDPRLAWIATRARGGCFLYGVREAAAHSDEMGLTHDSEDCPACGAALDYEWHTIGHQGSYRCPSCAFERPAPWLEVEIVETRGFNGQTIRLTRGDQPAGHAFATSLPGMANAYNIAAAACAARVLGIDEADATASLAVASNAWGRFETAAIDGHKLILTLGKNPASVAELLRIAAESDVAGVLFVMNDGFQDGRDVSWYWDVNPAQLAREHPCAITGARALDLALRLKYDDAPQTLSSSPSPTTFADPMAGLRWVLDATASGSTVLAIATYTGLVQLRAALVARHVLERMPV